MEVGVGTERFGTRRTGLSIEADVNVESIIVFEMEGEWTCLAELWSGEESSDTRLAVGLLTRAWSVFRGNLVLNLSMILTDAVTSFRHM